MITTPITSVEQLAKTLNNLPNNFIFRGHANATWPLQSALERMIGGSWSREKAEKFESYSLLQFKSKFHLYDNENISPGSKLAWLSIMQHYGVPTRLVDFSESPYVALYFALEAYNPNFPTNLAIFALDYSQLMDRSLQHIALKDSKFSETRLTVQDKQDKVFEQIVDRFAYDIAWVTEPTQLNARLDRQAGSFLLSGNRGSRIEDVLLSPLYENLEFFKYEIPSTLYTGLYSLLRKMNLTSKVLYGNLDGLARSLRMQMQIYSAPNSGNGDHL